jgi:SAM-dependent methyltransferase
MVRSHERTIIELEQLTEGRRLLDIGTGRGDLVVAARQRDWTAVGIEPYERAVDEARLVFGLELIRSEWRRGVVAPASFDAVVFNPVIEHLPNPREALEAAHQALARAGVVHLAAPNSRSVDVLVSRRTRAGLFDPPRHRYVFSDRSLTRLVRSAGFTIVKAQPQISRLLRPILQSRLSTLDALNAVATRDAGDVLRDDRARTALCTDADRGRRSLRAAILEVAVPAARFLLPGVEVRISARKS